MTPQITLTVTLQDISGIDVDGGSLLITLCGYGQSLPRVSGTAMIARVGTQRILLPTGISTGITLWGNDVIDPGGTYYSIALMDAKRNVVQTGIYQFAGTQTIDLSNASQLELQPNANGLYLPLVFGFSVFNGQVGNDVGPILIASRSGSVSKCKAVVRLADAAQQLKFRIMRNGVDVFQADPMIAAATPSGTLFTFTNLTSAPLNVNADDLFTLDILEGGEDWQFTTQLQS